MEPPARVFHDDDAVVRATRIDLVASCSGCAEFVAGDLGGGGTVVRVGL